MEYVRIYTVLGILNEWQLRNLGKSSFSFTIDTSSILQYRLSISYFGGEYNTLKSSHNLSTNDLDEIIKLISEGMNNNEND